jgi:hypothetical protein
MLRVAFVRSVPAPSLLDGAARARIIGAFALFVST